MLTLIKLKEDEQVIIYEYIPEDDISNSKGSVTFNKKDAEVIDFSLSEIENEEYFMLYRNKSFSVVRDFIEKQEFPENYKIAWY
ncbi:hypothetical protein C7P90_11325 [Staphylococcus aureus]|uniref:hypothetical protein n=1 Tax=Staphylococcus aureus TaxID=1280 RepID=UPI000DA867AF|nr:hypothetical protein [Staphylococcus aureus]PZK51795.1 hypothetical protein C7Q14_07780 [Staphylococcus aureus]PZK82628.1 hypothetical protein C7P74_03200 [Staphylococcus aureus]PZL58293.1 hypothetical protein C7P90_11325 [Staphylococcus aureus]PZL62350.1 hypothetical protein C7P75_04385 [Staphylococcus aureus]HDA2417342.1 hypothetical protein [Staphylococcus aureus]